jgi:glycine dehydrogenase subunit 1
VTAVVSKLADEGMLAGYNLEADYPELKGALLVCATETKQADDLERFTRRFGEVMQSCA